MLTLQRFIYKIKTKNSFIVLCNTVNSITMCKIKLLGVILWVAISSSFAQNPMQKGNIEEMVNMKRFRADLYYRLNVIPIKIPPLRERKEDILPLVNSFLESLISLYKEYKKLDEKAMKLLYDYSYPGNIRELKNLIERAYILSTGSTIMEDDFPKELRSSSTSVYNKNYDGMSLKAALDSLEKELIKNAIKNTKTSKEAADLLSVEPSTFTRKRQKYNL